MTRQTRWKQASKVKAFWEELVYWNFGFMNGWMRGCWLIEMKWFTCVSIGVDKEPLITLDWIRHKASKCTETKRQLEKALIFAEGSFNARSAQSISNDWKHSKLPKFVRKSLRAQWTLFILYVFNKRERFNVKHPDTFFVIFRTIHVLLAQLPIYYVLVWFHCFNDKFNLQMVDNDLFQTQTQQISYRYMLLNYPSLARPITLRLKPLSA